MNPEMHRSPDTTREIPKPKEVARTYIVQAKPIARIKTELNTNSHDTFFLTQSLWAEKSNASTMSSGQIQPVGGVQSAGETSKNAALREAAEETHLRILSLEHVGDIEYSLNRDDDKPPTQTNQHMFIGRALPLGVPYPIDPIEDKFSRFHYLDLRELGELYSTDSTQTTETLTASTTFFGNLRLPDIDGNSPDKKVTLKKPDQVYAVTTEMIRRLQTVEMEKRINVIKYFFKKNNTPTTTAQQWLGRLREGEFYEHQQAFKEFLTTCVNTDEAQDNFIFACDVSNFEEETQAFKQLESEKEGIRETESEHVLRCIFALLSTSFEDDTYLEIAEENPQLKKFVHCIRTFGKTISDAESTRVTDVVHSIDSTFDEQSDELLEEAFIESFQIPRARVRKLLHHTSEFISDLVQGAIIPKTDGTYHKNTIDEFNNIQQAEIGTLLRIALPGRNKQWKKQTPPEERSRMAFEARRKLALVYLLQDADQWYDTEVEKGIPTLEKIWGRMLPLSDLGNVPEYAVLRQDAKNPDKKILQNIVLFEQPNVESEEIVKAQQTKLRQWFDESTPSKRFYAEVATRTKKRPSMLRKFITRGYTKQHTTSDIFGRSITIIPDQTKPESLQYATTRITRTMTVNGREKQFDDYGPVFDIMESLTNEGVTISDFKPTPQRGQRMQSSGPGGGAAIRLAKFYIEKNGQQEEVQIFCPDEDGKTGLYWKKIKEDDDALYSHDRLIATSNLQSVTELLFPAQIYGEPLHVFAGSSITNRKKSGR